MVLDASSADKKLRRMALEIAERNEGISEIIIIGIKENGIFIAKKIEENLRPVFAGILHTVALTINKKNPKEVILSEDVDLENKLILLEIAEKQCCILSDHCFYNFRLKFKHLH